METFLKILSLLRMPVEVILLISIVTGLILFLPTKILQYLKLEEFLNEFGKYVGILFLITVGYLIIIIMPKIGILIKNYISKNKFSKKLEDILSNLTYIERCFLREFVIQGKEVIEVPIDNTEYISLYNKSVVIIASQNINRYVFGKFIFIRLNDLIKNKLSAELLALPSEEPTDKQTEKVLQERPQFLSSLNFRDRIMKMR